MAKQQKPMKGLGARYGIKPRKQYSQIHRILKSKRMEKYEILFIIDNIITDFFSR